MSFLREPGEVYLWPDQYARWCLNEDRGPLDSDSFQLCADTFAELQAHYTKAAANARAEEERERQQQTLGIPSDPPPPLPELPPQQHQI